MKLNLTLISLVAVLLKVTTCQWTLVIELFELNNPKNLELRQTDSNTQFCCCDDDGKCNENREDPKLDDCDRSCDTFVTVTLQECEPDTDCAISITSGTVDNSPSVSPSGHIFSFDLDRFPDETNFSLEVMEEGTPGSSIRLIDNFTVVVNASNFKIPLFLNGHFGIVTLVLSYQLRCQNFSICSPTPTDSVGESSEMRPIVTSVPSMLVDMETQMVVSITQTPESSILQQPSEAQDLQTLWMVVAIVLLVVIAILVIVFSIILGCVIQRKGKPSDNIVSKDINMTKNLHYDGAPINEGSANEYDGSDPQEVYTRVNNELYGDGRDADHDYDNDQVITQMKETLEYEEPSELTNDKGTFTGMVYSKLQRGAK